MTWWFELKADQNGRACLVVTSAMSGRIWITKGPKPKKLLRLLKRLKFLTPRGFRRELKSIGKESLARSIG
jgi:hypothetical protein